MVLKFLFLLIVMSEGGSLGFFYLPLKGLYFIWSKSLEREKGKELKLLIFFQKTYFLHDLQQTSWEIHKEIYTCEQRKMKTQIYHLNAIVPQMPGLGDFYFRNCRIISLWIIAKILSGIVSQTQNVWIAFYCLVPKSWVLQKPQCDFSTNVSI